MIERQTFADHAPAMRQVGWAVLPAVGKSPIKRGFDGWRFAPGQGAVARWAQETPDADIVYIPGLCSTGKGRKGIIAVDSDNETAIGQAKEFFGDTPGKVRTRRGQHHLYDGNGIDLGSLTSLRELGFEIDIKHGQRGAGIVASPPSVNEKDRSIRYKWDGCDETVIWHLPPFPLARLQTLLEKYSKPERHQLRDGSRKQGINDYLVSRVCHCVDFDELLDVARTWNEELRDHGYEPLEDTILIRRARVVWQHYQQGRFVPMIGKGGIAKMTRNELDALFSLNPKTASYAHTLLTRLKMEHSARCARGETFAICPKAMERDQVLPGWTRERYEKARDLLLEARLIKRVRPFQVVKGVRYAAQYSL